MYKPGIVACVLIILLVSASGCSILSTTPNSTVKQGVSGEASIAELPLLPEQYVARPADTPKSIASGATPTLPERIPVIIPAQRMTINGTALGNSTNSSATGNSSLSSSASVPVAQYTMSRTMGYAPFTVQFTDSSLNLPTSWSWDFGDGSYAVLRNPSHTYNAGGQFTVRLTAANTAGSGIYQSNVSAYAPGFSAIPGHGAAPLSVSFTDTGTGSPPPTAWYWDFGDGSTCSSQNKVHTYGLPGTYDVKFRISGPAGTTWVNRTAAVTVT